METGTRVKLLRAARFLLIAAAVSACGSPTPRFATGSDATLSAEGLRRVEDSGFQRAEARPGVSFARYGAVWLRYPADIAYRNPPMPRQPELGGDNYPLSERMAASWMASLRETFRREITDGHRDSVDSAGPGVLEIRIFLIDLVLHAPLVTLGGDDLQWVNSLGEVTIVIELVDSESGELLARLADRDQLAPESTRPARANERDAVFEVNRLIRQWAAQLRLLLDLFGGYDPFATRRGPAAA
jgi:hypothetical protein